MFEALSPQRRRFVVGLGVVVVVVVLVAVVAATRGPGPRTPGIPVVLVHGYGGSPASMETLATALRHQGRTVEAVALPQHGEADINQSASVLASAVDRTDASEVDLVGFSAGSIVVRSYLSGRAGAVKIHRVVLLGAPNHGAGLATLAVSADPTSCVDACQQLARGSGYLRALNSRPAPKVPIVSIWTGDDMTVTPPDSAVLPGADNIKVQSVCPQAHLAHGDLVMDPVAIGLTIVALRSDPGRLQCTRIRAIGFNALSS